MSVARQVAGTGWQGDGKGMCEERREGGGQGFGLPHGAKVRGGGRKLWLRQAHLKVPDHA